ncbi:MAG: hypothetical protein AB7S26_01900 [Sandaracinaceae bacterium]
MLSITSCSALGLDDVPEQEQGCRRCTELNFIDIPPECMSWQCADPSDPASSMCVLDLEDADEDGAPSAQCVVEGEGDCDDRDSANRPRGAGEPGECLDGQDNDCDEAIDEALFAVDVELEGLRDAGGFGWSSDGELAAYRGAAAGTLRLLDRDGSAAPVTLTGAASGANPTSTAVARTDDGVVVAYTPRNGCGRVVAGVVSGTALRSGSVPEDAGLPTSAACAPTGEVRAPVVSYDGAGDLLVGWLEGSADREVCGAPASAVVVSPAQLTANSVTGRASPLVAGEHLGIGGVAMTAIDDNVFIVASVDPGGGVTLSRVTVGVSPDVMIEERIEGCGAGCGRVAFASQGTALVLAMRAGDCDDAAIRLVRFDTAGGALTRVDETPIEIDAGDVGRLAVGPDAGGWSVAWSEGATLFYARVDAEKTVSPLATVQAQTANVLEPIAIATDASTPTLLAHDATPGDLRRYTFVPCGR